MFSKTINEIVIGDYAEATKMFTEAEVNMFAEISGDHNPAHVDEAYAQTTIFKTRIVHGMLTSGLISSVLGTKLPGTGTIYMSQDLKFLAPVYFGDQITARVEVVEIIEGKRVKLRTTCTNQDGKLVIDGVACVMPPKKKSVE